MLQRNMLPTNRDFWRFCFLLYPHGLEPCPAHGAPPGLFVEWMNEHNEGMKKKDKKDRIKTHDNTCPLAGSGKRDIPVSLC